MCINDFIFNIEIEEVLEELRRQLTLNGIQYLQKEPKRSGNHVQIQCPYHGNGQEQNRSAGIRREDGLFHCFACNEVHSLQEVISFCFGKTDDKVGSWGWKWLLKNFAVVQVEERKDIELDFGRTSKKKPEQKFVSKEELEEYRYYHKYMYQRRLTDDIIDLFDIGYDRKTKCITFPVRDIEGRCLFVARRSVVGKFFSYPEGVEKPVYGIYEIYNQCRQHEDLIICESMLDALTAWVYGRTAVALNGLGNELQFDQLNELPCRKMILATDSDSAGMRARSRIRANLRGKLVTEYVFPKGRKDLNELEKWEFEALEEIF